MDSHEVVIEIPKGSKHKYEINKTTGNFHLKRTLLPSFVYPTDYGFFNDTLAEDGDELDAIVLIEFPLFPGVVLDVRPIGALDIIDNKGQDYKVVCVATSDPRYNDINDISQIPDHKLDEIKHFFTHYADLDPSKTVEVKGWVGADEALKIVEASIIKFQKNQTKDSNNQMLNTIEQILSNPPFFTPKCKECRSRECVKAKDSSAECEKLHLMSREDLAKFPGILDALSRHNFMTVCRDCGSKRCAKADDLTVECQQIRP